MAQIDMNKLKAGTGNSTETDELKASEQPKTGTAPAELIDNATEKTEDTNKTEAHAHEEANEGEGTGNVIVRYVGGGVWRDCKGKLWASEKKTENILNERQYSVDEYEKREDIKFMVGYGAMKTTYVK